MHAHSPCRLGSTIDLAQDSKIDVVDDFHRKKKHEYLFAVRQPQRTYNLIAGDYDTRREWVDAIEQACVPVL